MNKYLAGALFLMPALLWPVAAATPSHAAPLVVKDVGGKRVDLAQKNRKAVVLVFIAHECPISNAYAPEINRLAVQYSGKGMVF